MVIMSSIRMEKGKIKEKIRIRNKRIKR